jgi:hypothetical protein
LEANDLEALWLEVCPYNSKRSLFIAGIYRPPSYKVDEDKKLGKNIENVYLLSKEMVLLGDFNVDYFAKGFHKHKLIKTLNNLNMSQLVNDITRPVSKSCLNHIWCSHPERLRNVQVKNSGMSDHLPVFATRIYKRNKGPNNNSHHVINFRNMKQLDTGKLISALKNAPWDCVFLLEDIDEVLDTWYIQFCYR